MKRSGARGDHFREVPNRSGSVCREDLWWCRSAFSCFFFNVVKGPNEKMSNAESVTLQPGSQRFCPPPQFAASLQPSLTNLHKSPPINSGTQSTEMQSAHAHQHKYGTVIKHTTQCLQQSFFFFFFFFQDLRLWKGSGNKEWSYLGEKHLTGVSVGVTDTARARWSSSLARPLSTASVSNLFTVVSKNKRWIVVLCISSTWTLRPTWPLSQPENK